MDIEKYKGKNISKLFDSDILKEFWAAKWKSMHYAFGDNVDYERMNDEVLYCEETADYLYSSPPPVPRYARGSRPILEAVVDEVTRGLSSDKEKALALLVYVRDLKKKSGNRDYFYGGTEEELIKKGEKYCERLARLLVALCEIAGIPARTIHHFIGGHVTCEVYLEEGWAYMDARHALFYIDERGKILSVREIIENRDVIYKQPRWVHDLQSPEFPIETRRRMNYHRFLHPGEKQLYAEYHLGDSERYHFEWLPSSEAFPVPERDDFYKNVFRPLMDKALVEIGATFNDFYPEENK